MNKEERKDAAYKAYHLLLEAHELLNDIIWEHQEGQSEHFDKLSKLEKIKLISSHSHIKSSLQEIDMWQDILKNI